MCEPDACDPQDNAQCSKPGIYGISTAAQVLLTLVAMAYLVNLCYNIEPDS